MDKIKIGDQEFDVSEVVGALKGVDGLNVLHDKDFTKRIQRETKGFQTKLTEMQEKHDELTSQYGEAQTRLQEIEDQGKTKEQKRDDEWAKLEKQSNAYRDQALTAQGALKAKQAEVTGMQLDRQINRYLGKTAKKPLNATRAAMIAKSEFKGLGLDDTGALQYTDPLTEISVYGDEATEAFDRWWGKQSDLHRGNPGGPPAGNEGGRQKAANGERDNSWRDMSDEDRFKQGARKGRA